MRSIPNLRVIDTGSAPKSHGKDRACCECGAVLSQWNPDRSCRLCQERAKADRDAGLLIRPMRSYEP